MLQKDRSSGHPGVKRLLLIEIFWKQKGNFIIDLKIYIIALAKQMKTLIAHT